MSPPSIRKTIHPTMYQRTTFEHIKKLIISLNLHLAYLSGALLASDSEKADYMTMITTQ